MSDKRLSDPLELVRRCIMKNLARWIVISNLLLVILSGCASRQAARAAPAVQGPDKFTIVHLSTSDGQLPDLLKVEAQKASGMGRHPFVEFYADWCPPCNSLKASMGDARMIDAYTGTYIIQLNLDEWQNKLAGTNLPVGAIPAFFELDATGTPTGRTITGA